LITDIEATPDCVASRSLLPRSWPTEPTMVAPMATALIGVQASCVQQPINRCMFGLLWGRKFPRGCPAAMTRRSLWTCPAEAAALLLA
jgi:hypothetical protein